MYFDRFSVVRIVAVTSFEKLTTLNLFASVFNVKKDIQYLLGFLYEDKANEAQRRLEYNFT